MSSRLQPLVRSSLRQRAILSTPRRSPFIRHASSSSSSGGGMSGLSSSSIALTALLGWSAVIFYIGGQHGDRNTKHSKLGDHVDKVLHEAKDKVGEIKEKIEDRVGGVKNALPSSSSSTTSSSPATDRPDPDDPNSPQTAAFNPETGEINWDCPCLGGMADGPCGEEFKLAFSCFVYSEAEPKGVDCVEKFRGMQECFRKHPDIYGNDDDEDEDDDDFELINAAEEALKLPEDEGVKL